MILHPGAETTEEELLAWGKEQMAAYKYPRMVEFVTALPMTSTGKILKRELAVRLTMALRLLDRFCAGNRVLIATWIGMHPRVLDRLPRQDAPR